MHLHHLLPYRSAQAQSAQIQRPHSDDRRPRRHPLQKGPQARHQAKQEEERAPQGRGGANAPQSPQHHTTRRGQENRMEPAHELPMHHHLELLQQEEHGPRASPGALHLFHQLPEHLRQIHIDRRKPERGPGNAKQENRLCRQVRKRTQSQHNLPVPRHCAGCPVDL